MITNIRISLNVVNRQCQLKRFFQQTSNLSYFHRIGKDPLVPWTIGQLLQRTADRYGDRDALVSRNQKKRITFQQILTQADKFAAGLASTGLQKGDRLGLWAPNMIEWYISKMASARLGLIMVALNPAYQGPEIEYCINKVGIKAIICGHKFKTQDYYEILKNIAPEIANSDPGKLNSNNVPSLESVIVIHDGKQELKGSYSFEEILSLSDEESVKKIASIQGDIRPDDGCNLQFTSGTTGKPKATLLSHFNHVNDSFIIGKRNQLDECHQIICVQNPFFHAFGVTISIMAALHYGATIVIPGPSYNPHESLDAIAEEKCTIIHGTPTMYVDLVRVQTERKEHLMAHTAVTGGAACCPELFRKIKSVLGVKQVKSVYGLTETTAVIFQSMPGDDEYRTTNTVGFLLDHVEAKVVDEKNRIVPFGVTGELCVRGFCNMLCYWGDVEKTKEIYGEDRWLKTGDQFVLQEDGYGKIVGRLKEMIIRGGENIFPKEIEDFLNTHPDILDTQVVGLPNERLGEEVCAFIRTTNNVNITREELAQFCKGKIAHFKIPSKLKVVPDFPKTASGKIQKFKLKEMYEKELLSQN